MKRKFDSTQEYERTLERTGKKPPSYVLRLYVSGMTPRSTAAFASIKGICEKHLNGRYDLEVIDIYQQPTLARDEQIIAAPTLVKRLPLPQCRMVGNLSQEERVLEGLGLHEKN
jgi:circadian clock protein KaiB